MSITDYASLKTAVADYLHRSDFSDSVLSNFVQFAEARLNRKLRLLQQQKEAVLSLAQGVDEVDLPDGWLENIDLIYTDDKQNIQPQNIKSLNSQKSVNGTTSKPYLYAVGDGKLLFEIKTGSPYSLTLSYFKKWDIESDDTNWLLTNAPDAYLYGSLLEAKAYAKNKQDVALWSQGLTTAIQDLNNLDNRSRRNATVRFEAALVRGGRFDINRGW